MKYNIAVVGATGSVGKEILKILDQRQFPVNELYALASKSSAGKKVSFGDQDLEIHEISTFDFGKVDISLFSAGSEVSADYATKAAKHSVVIDNTSFFRMFDNVPLVIPEVNIETTSLYSSGRNIISNPNCVAIPVALAVKPLMEIANVKRLVITSMQSVSGAGKEAMDELYNQTKGSYMNAEPQIIKFPKRIAFNLIPYIGDVHNNGYCEEEEKIAEELQKILSEDIGVSATTVRVPVFVGHSVSLNIEFENEADIDKVNDALKNAKNVEVVDLSRSDNYTSPIEVIGEDEVFISRIRKDPSNPNAINMWIVSDNLRKGAALNTVQIAEELVNNYL